MLRVIGNIIIAVLVIAYLILRTIQLREEEKMRIETEVFLRENNGMYVIMNRTTEAGSRKVVDLYVDTITNGTLSSTDYLPNTIVFKTKEDALKLINSTKWRDWGNNLFIKKL